MSVKVLAVKFVKDTLVRMKDSVPTIVKYAKVEMVPPKPTEIGEIRQGFASIISGYRSGSWRNITIREAFLNTLICVEVSMWFFIGEIIGKRNWIGYEIKY